MTVSFLPRKIETERLILRAFTKEDVNQVVKLCHNYNIYKSTLNIPFPYYDEHYYSWLDTHDRNFEQQLLYTFAITDKQTGLVLGCISLGHTKLHNRGELAYYIGEPYWNKGYATEASKAMLNFAFNNVGLNRVYALFFANNPASGEVMKKIGMSYEGTFREHLVKDGTAMDTCFYGILRRDYTKKNH